MDKSNNIGKVFVGGLAPQTSAESLKAFFAQYGAVADATVRMADDFQTGAKRSRGFGFVVFEDPNVVESVTSQGQLEIDGKLVDVKHIDLSKSEMDSRKVFVGGLPETATNDSLKAYFANIDPAVEDCTIKFDPVTGVSRRFAYVTLGSKEALQKVIAMKDQHYIEGKWIDVKESVANFKKGKGDKGKGFGKGGKAPGKGGKGFPGKGYAAAPYGAAYQQPAYGAAPGYPAAAYGAAPQYAAYAAAPAPEAAYAAPAYQAQYYQQADPAAAYYAAQAAAYAQPAAVPGAEYAYAQQPGVAYRAAPY